MQKTKDYFKPDELAERWQLSVGHLANLRSSGKGPKFLKLGNAIRYPKREIEAFEKKNTVSET